MHWSPSPTAAAATTHWPANDCLVFRSKLLNRVNSSNNNNYHSCLEPPWSRGSKGHWLTYRNTKGELLNGCLKCRKERIEISSNNSNSSLEYIRRRPIKLLNRTAAAVHCFVVKVQFNPATTATITTTTKLALITTGDTAKKPPPLWPQQFDLPFEIATPDIQTFRQTLPTQITVCLTVWMSHLTQTLKGHIETDTDTDHLLSLVAPLEKTLLSSLSPLSPFSFLSLLFNLSRSSSSWGGGVEIVNRSLVAPFVHQCPHLSRHFWPTESRQNDRQSVRQTLL